MDVQFGRTDRRHPSRLAADGVKGFFAALGFAFAATWPVVGPQLVSQEGREERNALPLSASPPAVVDAATPGPTAASEVAASPPASADAPVAIANTAPTIAAASVRGNAKVTAGADIRLEISATDADGDPIEIQTRWSINERVLETSTPTLPRSEIRRGDRIRATVIAFDGHAESQPFSLPTIHVDNAMPVITTFPAGFDASGAFVYGIGAIDPDGDRRLVYRLVQGPAGMTIADRDGVLSWSPTADQVGRHAVRVEVLDGRGGADRQAFELHVQRAPEASASLADRGP